MPEREHELQFEAVTAKLRAWREQVVVELGAPETRGEALSLKLQLDAAIGCLEFCRQHRILPGSQVVVVPETQTQTPSSVYRVLEDHETDRRECWSELEIDGEPLHLYPGDRIVSGG